MKNLTNNEFLKIHSIDNLDGVNLKEYKKDTWICSIEDKYYLIVKREFNNTIINNDTDKVELTNALCEKKSLLECKDLEVQYGDSDSFIIDMNGIDNFRFAKSLVFKDYNVRKLVLKLGLLKDSNYLRFGCAGARECDYHPGGEVFEYCLINGKDGSGLSQSVSGYLPANQEFSKSVSLYGKDKTSLREERIVYSHTAFLRESNIQNSTSLFFKIHVNQESSSLLDIINELSQKIGLSSYSIQMRIKTNNNSLDTKINGRVLRHMPEKPFNVLQDATDIGLEQLFTLNNNDVMYGVGTNYFRYEPEWKKFTGGRQYERRGHIHCTVVGNGNSKKHEVFHLRDVFVSPVSDIELVLNPVNDVYRVYPIYFENNNYFCSATDKNIDTLINEINNLK